MTAPPLDAGKASWRQWARSRSVPDDTGEVSARIVEGLARWLPAAPSGTIVMYLSMPGELDVLGVVEQTDRPCAVTRTPATGPLTLHPLGSRMERHRFGYDQPIEGSPTTDRRQVGVILVPGLVFDRHGGRLGHGKGYYDTLLPTLPQSAARVGIAREDGLVERLPTEAHDVVMTHLGTERGVRRVG